MAHHIGGQRITAEGAQPAHIDGGASRAPLLLHGRNALRLHHAIVDALGDEHREVHRQRFGRLRLDRRSPIGHGVRVPREERLPENLLDLAVQDALDEAFVGKTLVAADCGGGANGAQVETGIFLGVRHEDLSADHPGHRGIPQLVNELAQRRCGSRAGYPDQVQFWGVGGRHGTCPHSRVTALGMTEHAVLLACLGVGHGANGAHSVDDIACFGLTDEVVLGALGAQPCVVGGGHHPTLFDHGRQPIEQGSGIV